MLMLFFCCFVCERELCEFRLRIFPKKIQTVENYFRLEFDLDRFAAQRLVASKSIFSWVKFTPKNRNDLNHNKIWRVHKTTAYAYMNGIWFFPCTSLYWRYISLYLCVFFSELFCTHMLVVCSVDTILWLRGISIKFNKNICLIIRSCRVAESV